MTGFFEIRPAVFRVRYLHPSLSSIQTLVAADGILFPGVVKGFHHARTVAVRSQIVIREEEVTQSISSRQPTFCNPFLHLQQEYSRTVLRNWKLLESARDHTRTCNTDHTCRLYAGGIFKPDV